MLVGFNALTPQGAGCVALLVAGAWPMVGDDGEAPGGELVAAGVVEAQEGILTRPLHICSHLQQQIAHVCSA